MLKDYQETDCDIVVMYRDTDREHMFRCAEESGSVFNWGLYNVTCEARLCAHDIKPSFLFPVEPKNVDGQTIGFISFTHDLVHNGIRENRIYWRVIAEHKIDLDKKVINRGKIYLSEA